MQEEKDQQKRQQLTHPSVWAVELKRWIWKHILSSQDGGFNAGTNSRRSGLQTVMQQAGARIRIVLALRQQNSQLRVPGAITGSQHSNLEMMMR